jgi:hypothetical protein
VVPDPARVLHQPEGARGVRVAGGKFVKVGLPDDHGPRTPELKDYGCIFGVGSFGKQNPGGGCGSRSADPDQVFHRNGNPLQWAKVDTRAEKSLGRVGGLDGGIPHDQ